MHGFNLPLFLGVRPASNVAPFLKAQTAANVGALLTRRVGSIRGMRNLFQPTPAQKFSANGLVAMANFSMSVLHLRLQLLPPGTP